MAVKLSTSEILAAARAADGSRSARPQPVATESPRLERIKEQPVSEGQSVKTEQIESELHPPRGNGSVEPRSVGAMLHSVRGGGRAIGLKELRPPAIEKILADVRSSAGSDLLTPPSVAQVLADVRQGHGRSVSQSENKNSVFEKAEALSRPKRLSTAEILAAARNSKPASHTISAGEPSDQGKKKRGSTADILAAARRQGAGTPSGANSANHVRPVGAAAEKPPIRSSAGSSPKAAATGENGPRPVAIEAVLDAVRSEVARQPVNDPSLPSLPEMIAELRRIDRRTMTRRPDSADRGGWTVRFQRWFNRVNDTHQGASI